MQVVPIESEINGIQAALPYEKVSSIIESSQSRMYFDCVLRGINDLGSPTSKVINSHYFAEIAPDECTGCAGWISVNTPGRVRHAARVSDVAKHP